MDHMRISGIEPSKLDNNIAQNVAVDVTSVYQVEGHYSE